MQEEWSKRLWSWSRFLFPVPQVYGMLLLLPCRHVNPFYVYILPWKHRTVVKFQLWYHNLAFTWQSWCLKYCMWIRNIGAAASPSSDQPELPLRQPLWDLKLCTVNKKISCELRGDCWSRREQKAWYTKSRVKSFSWIMHYGQVWWGSGQWIKVRFRIEM